MAVGFKGGSVEKEWEHYPKPLIVALVLFGLSWLIGIVLGVVATELGREDATFGTASTIVAGVLVGQFTGCRVGSMMESRKALLGSGLTFEHRKYPGDVGL